MLNRISRGTATDIFIGLIALGGLRWAFSGFAIIREASYYDVYGKLTYQPDAFKIGIFFIFMGVGLVGLAVLFFRNLPRRYPIGTPSEWNECARRIVKNGKKRD